MASNGKQSKGNESKADDAVVEAAAAPVEKTVAEAARPVPAPAPAAAVPAVVVAAAPAVVAAASGQPDSAAGFAAAFDFDSSQWTKSSFDMWSENATAFFDFAEKVTTARTFDEVAELQSRFFTERLDAIMRQSSELLALAQEMMNVTVAPFCKAKAA